MFLKNTPQKNYPWPLLLLKCQKGAGIMVAVFVIVILGMFGTLIARYASMGAATSVEEYLWAQALYSAESAAQLRILTHDDGGSGGPVFPLTVEKFTIATPSIDDFSERGIPATLKLEAKRLHVTRSIELKYLL